MTLTDFNLFGVKYINGFFEIDEPYIPPDPPAIFRSMLPTDDPFPSDYYTNVPVGSGMTYVSTSDPMHTTLVGLNANLNYRDWTDPRYKVVETDPVCSGIFCYQYQPTGAGSLTNAQTAVGTGMGNKRWEYLSPDLRVPSIAAWQSTNNTDRKVLLDYQYDITITKKVYVNGVYDADQDEVTFYPAGTLRIEAHKFQRITSSTAIFVTNLSKQNLVTADDAYNEGAIASGIAAVGYMTAAEVAAAKAGDKTACKHTLKFGLANGNLKLGQKWPARTQDAPDPPYVGTIPYGTHIVLPMSFDEDAISDPLSRAFAWTLKHFGAYCLIRAGSTGVISFGVEPRGAGSALTSGEVTTVKNNLTSMLDSARISANSNLVAGTGAGTYNSVTRAPNRGVIDIAGGGTRVTVGLGLDDFDNVTGLKLPFDTNPANWV